MGKRPTENRDHDLVVVLRHAAAELDRAGMRLCSDTLYLHALSIAERPRRVWEAFCPICREVIVKVSWVDRTEDEQRRVCDGWSALHDRTHPVAVGYRRDEDPARTLLETGLK